jgi:hypothetical protein
VNCCAYTVLNLEQETLGEVFELRATQTFSSKALGDLFETCAANGFCVRFIEFVDGFSAADALHSLRLQYTAEGSLQAQQQVWAIFFNAPVPQHSASY